MAKSPNSNLQTPPLLVIVGETASGKTGLAIELAKRLDGEIICADSWTVRREVNIGTAKPTARERAAVPHHLLDIVGPDEDFTAAVFKGLANKAIKDINSRSRLPILTGGTGLYIDGVIYDYGFLPRGDRRAREELNNLSVPELLAKIDKLSIDPGEVDKRNKRRLIRLIETNGAQPSRQITRENTLILGIKSNREVLKKRITERVDSMLEAGLEKEVMAISKRYGWDCEALKGVGYAQWKDYFLHTQTLTETRQKIIKATLDLAKRQRTWFKRNKSIQWLETPVDTQTAVDLITSTLDT
jgi:tRNA dimethylallyltransferase